ncbi:hypothetical protein G6F60_015129 [Rhizopus arrhizus]|nr:hypothetical protein G6F60_015129 [Rhizopus arrhizus]
MEPRTQLDRDETDRALHRPVRLRGAALCDGQHRAVRAGDRHAPAAGDAAVEADAADRIDADRRVPGVRADGAGVGRRGHGVADGAHNAVLGGAGRLVAAG